MNATLPALAFRWFTGGALAAMSGAGTEGACVALARFGWHRDTFLMGVGCAWILTGASAFLMRRDFGRQVLLGVMEAFGLFFAALATVTLLKLDPYSLLPPVAAWVWVIGVLIAAGTWAGLRLPRVKATMRHMGQAAEQRDAADEGRLEAS